jgi:hypothetical protein
MKSQVVNWRYMRKSRQQWGFRIELVCVCVVAAPLQPEVLGSHCQPNRS